jgi:purine nucleosidase
MRIWIDTDIGSDVDDALTLAYVLRHPGFELAGVSTVFGDVALRDQIARALLRVAGAGDVPLLTGLGVPLTPGREGVMFGHEGRGIVEGAKPMLRTASELAGDERIDALADAIAAAQPDVLLAIGPLSNLAALLRRGVGLPALAIMGGKLEDVMLPGMIPQVPEWNWYCDPVAVQEVVGARHDTRPRVVPAEVTFRTRLEDGDVEMLAGGDALARTLATLCQHWLQAQREILGSKRPGIALHDPLTAAALVEDGLCPFEPRRIRIDERGGSERLAGAPNLDAATDVDTRRLRDHLIETWLPR